ncbi:hypothetical protein HanIR_Chr11g0555791 [Helianthus annuus]|nr:hypothetical protein HanIR_Chr11g0555791 [Helianthus annuus]KAJ0519391.1 hypothetical protein HanHA89_Chr11g0448231 [Helianthus annuus]
MGPTSAWARSSAAPSATVQSNSNAANALSATAPPSKSTNASTTFPTAPSSTATRRLHSPKQSANKTFVAGFATSLSFKQLNTLLITAGGHVTGASPHAPPSTAERALTKEC